MAKREVALQVNTFLCASRVCVWCVECVVSPKIFSAVAAGLIDRLMYGRTKALGTVRGSNLDVVQRRLRGMVEGVAKGGCVYQRHEYKIIR